MSATWWPLMLVVSAALIHATWNLLAKRAADAGPTFVFVFTFVAMVVYLPWTLWLLFHGESFWGWEALLCIAISGFLHLIYNLCLQRGYQVADFSVVYPVARGSAPLMSSVGAFLLLGEQPSLYGVLGLVAVVVGIALISTQGNLASFKEPGAHKGVQWGGLTGMIIASYTLVDAFGVKALLIHPVVLDWFSNSARLLFMAPWQWSARHKVRERMHGKWALAIAVGMLSPLSYILVLLALQMGAEVSFVAPAREMSMMVGALLGMVVLREAVGVWRLAGCGVLIVGVLLLSSYN